MRVCSAAYVQRCSMPCLGRRMRAVDNRAKAGGVCRGGRRTRAKAGSERGVVDLHDRLKWGMRKRRMTRRDRTDDWRRGDERVKWGKKKKKPSENNENKDGSLVPGPAPLGVGCCGDRQRIRRDLVAQRLIGGRAGWQVLPVGFR